jgi:hypothetical protein
VPFDASLHTRAEARPVPAPEQATFRLRDLFRWWRAPFWLLALLTGAKSFVDNPILGSRRLNEAGLHVGRLSTAHRLAAWRRARLASSVPADLREQFDRDGFVTIANLLRQEQFEDLRDAIFDADLDCRSHQQGDTITTRMAVGPELLERVPVLAALLKDPKWKALMAYVASTRAEPLYYVQAISGGVAEGPPDPQLELHSDTFHPSLKAWLFLTDVPEDGRPLTYVAGSHRLTPARLAWEKRRSVEIASADRLSQRGSLRVTPAELAALDLPEPTHFAVPANTLVIADTCGFHARAASDRPTLRVEIWAYSRRSPFLLWTGFDPLSWGPVAVRRAEWLGRIKDWLDRRGWAKQQWRQSGAWRDAVRR